MGTGVSCSIVLTPTDKTFYWTGETISGHVVLTVSKSIKLKSIDVNITGQLIYTERHYNSSTKSSRTVTVRKNFYVERHPLFIPPTNGISYDEDGYYLESNTYQWPFSVRLAKHLPPSLAYVNLNIPHIDYFLEVKLGRSWFHRNIRSQHRIMVIPRVPRPRNVRSLENEEANFRDLYIYGKLLRNYLLIGEPHITLELDIQNPSQTTIKEIMVKLIQRRHLAKKYGKVVIFEQSLPGIIDFQGNHLHRTFQVPVLPSLALLAPTTYYRDPGKPNQSWVIDYVFEVKVKTHLFFTNVTLEFELLVANSTNTSQTKYRNVAY